MPQPIRVLNQTWQELDGVQEPFSIRRFQGVSKLNPMFLEPGYAANLYNLSPSSYPALSVRGGMSKLAHINPSVRYVNLSGRTGAIIESGTTNLFPKDLSENFTSAWTSGTLNGTYTVSVRGGMGSLVLSGGATGTVEVGQSLTFTVSNATVTFTPTGGTPQYCQLEQKPYATTWHAGKQEETQWLDRDNGSGIAVGSFTYKTGSATGSYSIDTTVYTEGRSASQKITKTGGASSDRFGIERRFFITAPFKVAVLLDTTSLTPPSYAGVTVWYSRYLGNGMFQLIEEKSSFRSAATPWGWLEVPPTTNPTVDSAQVFIYVEGGNGTIHVQAVKAEGLANQRAPETLLVPASTLLDPAYGSVEFSFRLLRNPGHSPQYIFDGGGLEGKNLAVYVHTDGKLRCEYGTGTQTVVLIGKTVLSKDTDYVVRIGWSSLGVNLFLNNSLEASSATPPSISFGSVGSVGSKADGTFQLDGILINPGPLVLWKADFQQGYRMNTDPFASPGNLVLAFRPATSSTKTSQTDFDLGTKSGVDSTSKPGSVILARQV